MLAEFVDLEDRAIDFDRELSTQLQKSFVESDGLVDSPKVEAEAGKFVNLLQGQAFELLK